MGHLFARNRVVAKTFVSSLFDLTQERPGNGRFRASFDQP
jgi:hypothetical protein